MADARSGGRRDEGSDWPAPGHGPAPETGGQDGGTSGLTGAGGDRRALPKTRTKGQNADAQMFPLDHPGEHKRAPFPSTFRPQPAFPTRAPCFDITAQTQLPLRRDGLVTMTPCPEERPAGRAAGRLSNERVNQSEPRACLSAISSGGAAVGPVRARVRDPRLAWCLPAPGVLDEHPPPTHRRTHVGSSTCPPGLVTGLTAACL